MIMSYKNFAKEDEWKDLIYIGEYYDGIAYGKTYSVLRINLSESIIKNCENIFKTSDFLTIQEWRDLKINEILKNV